MSFLFNGQVLSTRDGLNTLSYIGHRLFRCDDYLAFSLGQFGRMDDICAEYAVSCELEFLRQILNVIQVPKTMKSKEPTGFWCRLLHFFEIVPIDGGQRMPYHNNLRCVEETVEKLTMFFNYLAAVFG